MGWSIRSYVRTKTGEITRFPSARFERLWNRDEGEAMPQHAGEYVCFAIAFVETEGGEPVRLARVDYLRLKLDAEGRLDEEARMRMLRLCVSPLDWLYPATAPPSRVIEAGPRFRRRQREAEFSWKPTAEEQRRIVRSALAPRGQRKERRAAAPGPRLVRGRDDVKKRGRRGTYGTDGGPRAPRPRGRGPQPEPTIVGVGWYREDQWELLRRLAAEPDRIEETYDAWRVVAIRVVETIREQGLAVERVDVDVKALAKWCRAEGRPLIANARSLYAAWRTRSRHVPH